jgi:hypothetical protein
MIRWTVAGVRLSALALVFAASTAQAQWKVGAFVGGEHESSWDEFLLLGIESRGAIAGGKAEVAPRFSYFLREGTTRLQVDVNLIKPLVLASSGRVTPYLGLGIALENLSFDDSDVEGETSFGFNYVVGGAVRTAGALEPYGQFQYSVLNDAPNVATVTLGLLYRLGGAPASAPHSRAPTRR